MLFMRGLTKMVNKRNVVINGVNLPNHIIARTNALQYAVKTWQTCTEFKILFSHKHLVSFIL